MAKRHDKKKEAARRMREQQQREQRRRQIVIGSSVVAAVVAIAVLVALGLYLNQGYEVNKPKAEHSKTALTVGDGPVEVDLYVDFICPVCGDFEKQSGKTIKKYADEGKITLNQHPLGLLDDYSTTQYSSRSSAAAVCAADQDKFFEYSSLLWQNQPPEKSEGLSDKQLISYGEKAGMKGKAAKTFESCVQDETYRGWVQQSTDDAVSDGHSSTPTIMIDGKEVSNKDRANFDKLLEDAVKKAGDSDSKSKKD